VENPTLPCFYLCLILFISLRKFILMRLVYTLLCTLITFSTIGQSNDLSYYLPDVSYNTAVPSPADFLGFDVGEWHVSHDQLRYYMEALAKSSDRVRIEEYARSYENRPLLLLTITSERNHRRIDDILEHRKLITDPSVSDSLNLDGQPIVIYQGYSIHGNEASGANAALLVAYYLAAGQSAEINDLLDNVVILLDPCYNPDGLQRFSTWVNAHKNKNLASDPADREHNEVWPRGRTNHYWFDLNRDWLLLQHPESRGRIANFHKWKPNILTDHHEMGTNSTFFFMPGEPTRVNPTTPRENQQLTAAIGAYHARALDAIGSMYYSREGFDDFYYGKGSTYPDANGCIGILFEQASARGHVQETVNGLLSFPFAIRNHVTTSLSTQEAAVGLKSELANFQREFYKESRDLYQSDSIKAYVFGEQRDRARLNAFIAVLLQHKVEVYEVDDDEQDELEFIVPMQQSQYRMVKAIFDRQVEFDDSLFYDVSAWTLPLAFDIHYEALLPDRFAESLIGEKLVIEPYKKGAVKGGRSNYGYVMSWDDYYAPKAAYALLNKDLVVKSSQLPFTAQTGVGDIEMSRGSLFIPAQNQKVDPTDVFLIINDVVESSKIDIYSLTSGHSAKGYDMGSGSFKPLKKPEVLLIVGAGVSSYEAGELWHLFDQRYGIPVSKVETGSLGKTDLGRYNVILMAGGNYNNISSSATAAIKRWVSEGGTLVTLRGAIKWASSKGLINARLIKSSDQTDDKPARSYEHANRDRRGGAIGGAIFEVKLDLTHPLTFGYDEESLAVFRRGTDFYDVAENVYATPARYSDRPLLAGYINDANLTRLSGTAAILIGGSGSGKVIAFVDNLSFRAYWWGTQKLIANAAFFGSTISHSTVESPPNSKTSDKK
jgi:zinc carboxypeptidase